MLVISWLILGSINAFLAKRQGKNPYLWFLLGSILGIFGIFLLYYTPAVAPSQKQTNNPANPTTIDIITNVNDADKEKFWYYLDPQNKQFGPMSFDALTRAWHAGTITQKTYVWNENLEHWIRFEDCIQIPHPTS